MPHVRFCGGGYGQPSVPTPTPVAVLRGPEHTFELANPIALETWGKDARVLGQPLLTAMPELRGQPFVGYLDEVLRTGVPYEGRGEQARVARGPGGELEDVYFDFVYAPLRAPNGSIDGVLVCGFEVTAQVMAQQKMSKLLTELEAKERHFRELVENLPELAWTARPDGHIDYYNGALQVLSMESHSGILAPPSLWVTKGQLSVRPMGGPRG